jgi:hypothetical protein
MDEKSKNPEGALEKTVEFPQIKGVKTINHSMRVSLGINCSEYVLMDYLAYLLEKKLDFNAMKCYQSTGFKSEEVGPVLSGLIQKGFVVYHEKTDKLDITKKWYDNIPTFINEFEQFWTIKGKDDKMVNAWPGSKPEALRLFIKLRKNGIEFDYLMKQRNDYFKFLRYQQTVRNFNLQKMMCTVFLNLDKKRYEEEWELQVPEEYRKPKEEKKEILTEKDLTDKYQ